MALSYAMHWIESNSDSNARLPNYAEIPRQLPAPVGGRGRRGHNLVLRPRCRALALRLRLQRWQVSPAGNQKWRAPLREALDLLRDATAPLAEDFAAPLLVDLWAARDDSHRRRADRSPASG